MSTSLGTDGGRQWVYTQQGPVVTRGRFDGAGPRRIASSVSLVFFGSSLSGAANRACADAKVPKATPASVAQNALGLSSTGCPTIRSNIRVTSRHKNISKAGEPGGDV